MIIDTTVNCTSQRPDGTYDMIAPDRKISILGDGIVSLEVGKKYHVHVDFQFFGGDINLSINSKG